MENGKTYIIVCRQGRRKDECPLVTHQGWKCIECSYVGYILRTKKSSEENIQTETENES